MIHPKSWKGKQGIEKEIIQEVEKSKTKQKQRRRWRAEAIDLFVRRKTCPLHWLCSSTCLHIFKGFSNFALEHSYKHTEHTDGSAGKGIWGQAWQPEFNPRDPHDTKTKAALASDPLTSTLTLWCMYKHIHNSLNVIYICKYIFIWKTHHF